MTHPKSKMWSEICAWVSDMSENTSLHGIVWYNRTPNRVYKSIICFLSFLIVVGLPTILVIESIKFWNDETVLSKIDQVQRTNTTYPNITVCHPGYFDWIKMQGEEL